MMPSDFDICECGDYRHQHQREDGFMGPCRRCPPSEMCMAYRPFQVVTWVRTGPRE